MAFLQTSDKSNKYNQRKAQNAFCNRILSNTLLSAVRFLFRLLEFCCMVIFHRQTLDWCTLFGSLKNLKYNYLYRPIYSYIKYVPILFNLANEFLPAIIKMPLQFITRTILSCMDNNLSIVENGPVLDSMSFNLTLTFH